MIEYKPVTAVWEITMGCNMRCKHCGSSCENALEGELSTEEALRLCDDLGKLGFQWITLSGGEPTTRRDWHLIAKRLNDNGIIPNMITNGWLLNEEILYKAAEAGVNTIAISLDGLEKTHDFIRKEGSYQRVMHAFDLMKKNGNFYSAITTINNINIKELPDLKKILVEKGVHGWQLQLGLPMGNMARNSELLSAPQHMDDTIDFAFEAMKDGEIDMQLADCIGYYNLKEIQVRNKMSDSVEYAWTGCGAGKHSMGILHNGDILGCTSVRDRNFIEGNIRETPIAEIWNNPDNFAWNRKIEKSKLGGICGKCKYGRYCLGGCGNTRLTMGGDIYSENKYCSYNNAINKARQQFDRMDKVEDMKTRAGFFIERENFQLAELLLARALEFEGGNCELLSLYGYVSFMLENFEDARKANEKVLRVYPRDAYANKGMGLSLSRLGETERGIEYLKKAISYADESFTDPYFDLALVLMEKGDRQEALGILNEGRKKSKEFEARSQSLYEQLVTAK